jgi:deazaflavin-dependent oxidoreductase (nitroreductase family)
MRGIAAVGRNDDETASLHDLAHRLYVELEGGLDRETAAGDGRHEPEGADQLAVAPRADLERVGVVVVALHARREVGAAGPAMLDDVLAAQPERRLALGGGARHGDVQVGRGSEEPRGEPVEGSGAGRDGLRRDTILRSMAARVNSAWRRHSPARGRRLSAYEQVVENVAASRAGAWAFLHLFSAADRRLLALTRGRLSLAVGAPVGLLETTGARTGRRRRTPLLYLSDGLDVVIVASNCGGDRDPAWLHNLRALENARLLTREHGWRAYRARIATGAERARRWALATDLFDGYRAYEVRTAREISVVVLEAQRGIEIPPAT